MSGGLYPVKASPAVLVNREIDARRDLVRLVVGSVFLTEFPVPRREARKRALPRRAPRPQPARNTGEMNADLEDLGSLWSGRLRDDTLDCSGLEDLFSSERRPLNEPPPDAWFYPSRGLVAADARRRRTDKATPANAGIQAAAVGDDTLKCDGIAEFFAPAVEAATQPALTVGQAATAVETPLPAAPASPPSPPEPAVVDDPPSPYSAFADDFVKMSRGYRHLSQEIEALIKACGELKEAVQPQTVMCAH
jgi:hypothetical protein